MMLQREVSLLLWVCCTQEIFYILIERQGILILVYRGILHKMDLARKNFLQDLQFLNPS